MKLIAPALCLALVGCEAPLDREPTVGDPAWHWTLDIVIDPSEIEAYSPASPGQVLAVIDQVSFSMAVVCDPAVSAVHAQYFQFGCTDEQAVEVWLEPLAHVEDHTGRPIECGEHLALLADAIEAPEGAARAEGVLFEGQHDCLSTDDLLELTLER